jgi:hypothetical protein
VGPSSGGPAVWSGGRDGVHFDVPRQVHLMCRADWGQLVRTEHHLASPNGPRGGASDGLTS